MSRREDLPLAMRKIQTRRTRGGTILEGENAARLEQDMKGFKGLKYIKCIKENARCMREMRPSEPDSSESDQLGMGHKAKHENVLCSARLRGDATISNFQGQRA